jgi:anaphase-promoting complex subunit 8
MGIDLEMTNPQAAVEWFRRAIGVFFIFSSPRRFEEWLSLDVNPKDYRAWSGLGKAYSVLCMHSYSLHHHPRALRLRLR